MPQKPLIALLALAALGGGGFWLIRSSPWAATPSVADLTAYGNVEIREVNLAFRVGGRVASLAVDEGDAVTPGQVLAQMDPEPLQRQLAAAQARVGAAQAELARLQAGYRAEEISQAEARLAQAQASAERARQELARQRQLNSASAGTQQGLEQAEAAAAETRAQVALAQASLDLFRSGYRPEEIAVALAKVAEAEADQARLELQIADATLKAPSAGTISVRAVEPGAIVNAGQTVLTLSLEDRLWVRAYLPEPRLGELRPGMPVEVYTDSRPGQPYRGQVGFIAPKAEFTPKNVETEDLRSDLVFRFRILLDEPDAALRQGMPVTVRLLP